MEDCYHFKGTVSWKLICCTLSESSLFKDCLPAFKIIFVKGPVFKLHLIFLHLTNICLWKCWIYIKYWVWRAVYLKIIAFLQGCALGKSMYKQPIWCAGKYTGKIYQFMEHFTWKVLCTSKTTQSIDENQQLSKYAACKTQNLEEILHFLRQMCIKAVNFIFNLLTGT